MEDIERATLHIIFSFDLFTAFNEVYVQKNVQKFWEISNFFPKTSNVRFRRIAPKALKALLRTLSLFKNM